MYWYDLQDFVFLLKCLKYPNNNINIHRYITFMSSETQMTTHNQNILDLSLSLITLKIHLQHYLWTNFINSFDPNRVCTFELVC